MRYLSGVWYPPLVQSPFGGFMHTPEIGNKVDLNGVVWAADNGCFTRGERFSSLRWIAFLERYAGKGQCLFAVAPDVPFDMEATLNRSLPYLSLIRKLGYPAALAIQNGVEACRLDWSSFDAVFIAGDKPFKTGRIARDICELAREKGKHIHIARRNSARAIQEAQGMGADTCDGTFLRFAPEKNWPRLQRWFEVLKPETQMELW